MKIFLIALVFLHIFVGLFVGCSREDDKEGRIEFVTKTKIVTDDLSKFDDYKLGDTWDRSPTQAFHSNHYTVLKGEVSLDSGVIHSNFIFLQKINEFEAYFIGTVHSLPQSCEEEGLSLYLKENMYQVACTETYSVVPDTDAVIFSVRFYEKEILNELIPVVFYEGNFRFGQRLRFYGVDMDHLIPGYYPLVSDSSQDCRLMSSYERRIVDPDKFSGVGEKELWSMALTCDVQHGDSGGLLVNRVNEFMGVLWTGAFPKKGEFSSARLKSFLSEPSSLSAQNKWSKLNYMVSSKRIKKHFEFLKSSTSQ